MPQCEAGVAIVVASWGFTATVLSPMKRLESMPQRLKARLLRLDVMLHPLSGLLLSLKAGLRRLDEEKMPALCTARA